MEVGRISLAPGARKTPTASDDGGVGYKKRTLFQLGGHPSHSWFHARLCTNFSPCTYIQDDDGGEDEHEFIFCRGFFFSANQHTKGLLFLFLREILGSLLSQITKCVPSRENFDWWHSSELFLFLLLLASNFEPCGHEAWNV